ncbi:MAG: glycosyltransferase [Clostridia bacterium]|nr:glycosyltransferase [Clostridia bacterium]
MKVMQINAVYGVGSTGVIVEDLHNLSLKNGIESYVSYSTTNKNPNEIKNGYVIGDTLGKKMHAVLSRIGGKQAYFSSFATKKLIKHIENVKPDIVHLHNLHSNYVNLNRLLDYLGEREIKTVVTLHDCWFYTGGCFHYTAVGCDKWQKSCGNCPKKNQDTPALLRDNSAKILADRKKYFGKMKNLTMTGVSGWMTDEGEKTVFKGKKTEVIYNGIDTEFFVPTPSDFRKKHKLEDKFLILALANKWFRPINKKTFDYVCENLPDDSVIVMLGCTESQRQGLPANVLPLDFIKDRDELRKVYSACDVFANCTREESFSLVNVEAQSCGTPVVTYRNTGAQETVDNKCSFSIENGNEKEFFEAIMKIKELGKKELSNDCVKWVKENFDRDENYMKYIELYRMSKEG